MNSYKEKWIEFYYDAIDEGKSEDEAEKIANDGSIDYFCNLIDLIKEKKKYMEK